MLLKIAKGGNIYGPNIQCIMPKESRLWSPSLDDFLSDNNRFSEILNL